MSRTDFQAHDKVGPYTLLSKLGEGQFGIVWLAEKRTSFTSTKFALKLPIPGRVIVGAIEQEAKLWEKASGHKNVVNLIEAEEYDVERTGITIARKQIVIVSEYVPDGSLEKWLRDQGGRASVEDATVMISEILLGLSALHTQGIIHRDLKPANILLQGQTPRIADFGISRALTTGSYRFTGPFGSLAYMAPETIASDRSKRRISKRTDLWSIGVIFYELLTGSLPFPQRDISACMEAIRKSPPAPLPSSIPPPIVDVVNRALRKNPAKRFRSAPEMLAALRAASTPPHLPPPMIHGPSALGKLASYLRERLVQLRRRVTAYRPSSTLVRNTILSLIVLGLAAFGWSEYKNWPKQSMERGKQRLAQGDEDAAIREFNYVISREKDNAEAYLLLGTAFYNKGVMEGYQKAIDSYNTFINFRKDDPRGYIARGLAYHMKCECDQAITDFSTAINLKKDDPGYYSYRAAAFADKGDFTSAVKDYDRIIELRNNDPEHYMGRAALFRQRGDKGDAENILKDLTRAIEVSQNEPKYYVARALFFSNDGSIDKAIKDYDEIINRQKNSPDYYIARAKLYFDKDDIPNGMKDYDHAIELKGRDPQLYFDRANILFDHNKYDLAIEDYNRYSNVRKDDATPYYNRGLCYYNKEDYKNAIEQFSQATDLKKDDDPERDKFLADAYHHLGLSYFDDGNNDKAIEQFGQAIKYWLAYDAAQKTASDTSSSRGPAEESCTCNPSKKTAPVVKPTPASAVEPDAYYYRGLALLNIGKKDDAIADLRKTLELTNNDETRREVKTELQNLGVR